MSETKLNNENTIDEIEANSKKRLLSIDFFKGLSIILMVFVNTTRNFNSIPAWSKHAGDFGLTYVDLIAPFFIFMMALNFRSSFTRRLRTYGRLKTYWRFLYRYLIFIGLGMILFIREGDSGGIVLQWGTLQVLGVSGLIALPFIEFKKIFRLLIAIVFLLLHQLILETPFKSVIYDAAEGGFIGSLSWGGMMLLSTVVAEGITSYKEGDIKQSLQIFGYGGIILTVIGLILNFSSIFNVNLIISRQYMTISYSIISIGLASIFFLIIFYTFELFGRNHPLLRKDNIISILGKNALILFVIHLIMVSISDNYLPKELPLILAFLIGVVDIVIIWTIGYFMNKIDMQIII